MPNNKKRSRIVSFRLSEEEYDSLKSISELSGARSVSDFTRSVACQNNDINKDEKEAIQEILSALKDKIELIDKSINKLTKMQDEKNATDYTDSHRIKKPNEEQLS